MPALLLAQGDALHLPFVKAQFHCCVTSPPYYGLRNYSGLPPTLWPGGSYSPVPGAPPLTIPGPTEDEMTACAHVWEPYSIPPPGHCDNGITSSTLQGGKATQAQTQRMPTTGAYCQRCGCWRGTLGNEPDVSSYIWHTLLWLREVRRCLRDDGVCWVIIGDAFSSGDRQSHGTRVGYKQQTNRGMNGTADPPRPPQPAGYAQGSLLGIPAQVMLAAMADGWVVRNDVTWGKNSPMPESIRGWRWQQARCACLTPNRVYSGTQKASVNGHREHPHGGFTAALPAIIPDPACPTCGGTGRLEEEVLRKGSWRHTRATETILMLTKGMGYWANGEAVREETVSLNPLHPSYRPNSVSIGQTGRKEYHAKYATSMRQYNVAGRNPRNVVTPAPSNLGLEHYAAFPPDLISPLIRATCPERCCPTCGMGWAPVIELEHRILEGRREVRASGRHTMGGGQRSGKVPGSNTRGYPQYHDLLHGLRPSCAHYCTCGPLAPAPGLLVQDRTCPHCAKLLLSVWVPGVVMDCFSGSGTTLLVGRELGRRSVGLEASPTYIQLSRERLGLTALTRWEGRPTSTPAAPHYGDLPLFAPQEVP